MPARHSVSLAGWLGGGLIRSLELLVTDWPAFAKWSFDDPVSGISGRPSFPRPNDQGFIDTPCVTGSHAAPEPPAKWFMTGAELGIPDGPCVAEGVKDVPVASVAVEFFRVGAPRPPLA